MNISISLPPELLAMVKAKVQSGRYSSTSEVMREALRLLEREDQREAWREGIESGDAGTLDFAELRAEAHRKLVVVKS